MKSWTLKIVIDNLLHVPHYKLHMYKSTAATELQIFAA